MQPLVTRVLASLLFLVPLFSTDLLGQTQIAKPDEIQGFESEFPAMGTLINIKLFGSDASAVSYALKAVQERARKIESILTDYDPESETSKLTEVATEGQAVSVSEDLWNVLTVSDRWHQVSSGAFDASLGNLTRLWRTQRRTKKASSNEQRKTALDDSGWKYVHLDFAKKTIRLDGKIRLDFGAIGKGYLVDQLFEQLQHAGFKMCLVNMSGNMRCGDAPPGREGWRIEVSPLEKGHPSLRRLLLKNISIATSGDLWQYYSLDGKRYSHILDPATGIGVPGPIAVTVLAPNAADADACATAVCVLGPTRGSHMVQSMQGVEALILEHSDADQPVRYITTEHFGSVGQEQETGR
jgi:FAD:protein FMN transferase